MARDLSAKSLPTHCEFFSISACNEASFFIAVTISGVGAGCATGATALSDFWLPLRGTAGAIGAFATSPEPQLGQVTRPRADWLSKSTDEPNHPSKRCPDAQERSKTIIARPT